VEVRPTNSLRWLNRICLHLHYIGQNKLLNMSMSVLYLCEYSHIYNPMVHFIKHQLGNHGVLHEAQWLRYLNISKKKFAFNTFTARRCCDWSFTEWDNCMPWNQNYICFNIRGKFHYSKHKINEQIQVSSLHKFSLSEKVTIL
jgi:hypothetical protein